jgi:hypothetical protein
VDTAEPGARAILARFADALAQGDANGAATCFAPGATYTEPPRFAFSGRAAIAAFFADFTARHHAVSFTIARVLAGPLPPSPPPLHGEGGAGAGNDADRSAYDSPPRAGEGPGEWVVAVEWRFAYTRTSDGERTIFEGMCWLDLAADGLIARWHGFSARVAE